MHNTCEDSLLAVPLIIDLAVLCEVCERIKVRRVLLHIYGATILNRARKSFAGIASM